VRAQALGNLQSTLQENVISDDGTIEILPADPQVIYVPEYQPDMVYGQRPDGSRSSLSARAWRWAHGSTTTLIGGITTSSSGAMTSRVQRIGGLIAPANARRRGEPGTVWQPRNPAGPAASGMDRGYYSRPGQSAVTVIGPEGPHHLRRHPCWPGPQHGNCNRRPTEAGGTARNSRAACRAPESVVVQHPARRPVRRRPTAH